MERPDYVFATLPQRLTAKIIDVVTSALFLVGATAGLMYLPLPQPLAGILPLLPFLLSFLYMLLGDGLFNGSAIGKRLMGLRVIQYRFGTPCTLFQCMVNNAAGLGALRVLILAEEAGEIEKGGYRGTVVIDERKVKRMQATKPDPQQSEATELDLAGIRSFVRRDR